MSEPGRFLRERVNPDRCVSVKTLSGETIYISPCLIKAADILGDSLTIYQSLVLKLRNAWAKAGLRNVAIEIDAEVWAQVALFAIQQNYDATRDHINAWLAPEGEESTLVEIASIACGHVRENEAVRDQRRRALGVMVLGCAGIPLTASEIAALSDFAANTNQSPF